MSPPKAQHIFNFMHFFENMAKSYVGAPLTRRDPLLVKVFFLNVFIAIDTCFHIHAVL